MSWKQFQKDTANLFRAAGCDAEVEKTISGVRGQHEVDVYVSFKKYGIQCQWIIECKCWNSNVPKEKVAALQSIISDVGADRGVIISKKGFQSGAIRLATNSNITLASLEDLKDYIKEETEKREVDFLEAQLTHYKYKFLNLGVREKSKYGFTRSYPKGIDGGKVMELFGKICIILMSFEQLKIGNSKLPYKFDDATGKTMVTDSIETFLESVKDIIVECDQYSVEAKNESA